MEVFNPTITRGRKKALWLVWGGLGIPAAWTVADIAGNNEGFGVFFFIVLVLGLFIGSLLLDGNRWARWVWVIFGFFFSVLFFIGAVFSFKTQHQALWQFLGLSGLLVLFISIFTMVDTDVGAFIRAKRVEKGNYETERLIEEIGKGHSPLKTDHLDSKG